MNWLTYSSGAMLGLAVGFALWQGRRLHDPHDYVSQRWLRQLEQREQQEGMDGVCWTWPLPTFSSSRRA